MQLTDIHPSLVALGRSLYLSYHDGNPPEPWDIAPDRKIWIRMASQISSTPSEIRQIADNMWWTSATKNADEAQKNALSVGLGASSRATSGGAGLRWLDRAHYSMGFSAFRARKEIERRSAEDRENPDRVAMARLVGDLVSIFGSDAVIASAAIVLDLPIKPSPGVMPLDDFSRLDVLVARLREILLTGQDDALCEHASMVCHVRYRALLADVLLDFSAIPTTEAGSDGAGSSPVAVPS